MKILIVEDSMFVRKILEKNLSSHFKNCEILTAENGEKGLELFSIEKPDIITTDLLMPVLNGQSMLRKIRKIDQDVPVIVISADVQKAAKEEVEELGIVEFINKPITKDKADLLIKLITEVYHVK